MNATRSLARTASCSHVTRQPAVDCAPQKGEVRAMVRPAANTSTIYRFT